MVSRESVGTLLAGIAFLLVSLIIFYLDFAEGMWEGTEFDWLGLISGVFMFVLAIWAIQDSLRSKPKKSMAYFESAKMTRKFCVKCGNPIQEGDSYCSDCGAHM